MARHFYLIALSLLLGNISSVLAADEKIFFVEPKDGATVTSPFKVKFGGEGVKVAPAGTAAPGTGHYHVIINGAAVPEGEMVPMDNAHKHYGKNQTEAELTLPPGDYTLTLQFADGMHMSYGKRLSQTIMVHVK